METGDTSDAKRPDFVPGFTVLEFEEHELKGVPDRWRLYRVVS